MRKTRLRYCALLVAVSACGNRASQDKQEQLTIVVEADRSKLAQEEADLQKRLEEFQQERERLRLEQEKLLAERAKSGAPAEQTEQLVSRVKEIFERERRLWEREKRLEEERQNIAEKKEKLVSSIPAGDKAPPADNWLVRRESQLAEREAALAGREKQLAEREAALAKREAEFLATQARLAALPAAVRLPGGKPVSAAAAQKAYTGVLGEMRKKGILTGDLPPEGVTLLQEMEKARKESDHSKLAALAEQLQIVIRTTRVDAGFLDRKFQRLSQIISSSSPPGNVRTELGRLQRQATTLYSDGKFAQANSELNRMFSLLGER